MRLPWWLPLGGAPEISASDLSKQLRVEKRPQVVDVRTESEFAGGHISHAVNAPIQRFRQSLPDLNLDPDRPVYVICRTAHRSVPATRLLNEQGFQARQLAKGMNAWWAAGLPTVHR